MLSRTCTKWSDLFFFKLTMNFLSTPMFITDQHCITCIHIKRIWGYGHWLSKLIISFLFTNFQYPNFKKKKKNLLCGFFFRPEVAQSYGTPKLTYTNCYFIRELSKKGVPWLDLYRQLSYSIRYFLNYLESFPIRIISSSAFYIWSLKAIGPSLYIVWIVPT